MCSSSCRPDFFDLVLLYDARPRLLLYESCTVEKQRSVLSSPEMMSIKLFSATNKQRYVLDQRRLTVICNELPTAICNMDLSRSSFNRELKMLYFRRAYARNQARSWRSSTNIKFSNWTKQTYRRKEGNEMTSVSVVLCENVERVRYLHGGMITRRTEHRCQYTQRAAVRRLADTVDHVHRQLAVSVNLITERTVNTTLGLTTTQRQITPHSGWLVGA